MRPRSLIMFSFELEKIDVGDSSVGSGHSGQNGVGVVVPGVVK